MVGLTPALRWRSLLASNGLDALGSQFYSMVIDLFLVSTLAVSATVLGAINATGVAAVPLGALAGGLLADAAGAWLPLTIWPLLTALAALSFVALTRSS